MTSYMLSPPHGKEPQASFAAAASNSRKRACVKTRIPPDGHREVRTPIRPAATVAISTQFPLGLLWWDLRHRGA
jgi:hypothetical protein